MLSFIRGLKMDFVFSFFFSLETIHGGCVFEKYTEVQKQKRPSDQIFNQGFQF